jgi:hypothetical protein
MPVGAHPRIRDFDLLKIPLLAGKVMRYGGNEIAVPGRAGRVQVLESLGVPQEPLFSQEAKRMRVACADLPRRRVNLGWATQACLHMLQAARKGGDGAMAAAWRTAHGHVYGMLTTDVQAELTPVADTETADIR